PDQQRAVLPRLLPRAARQPRAHRQRRHEAGGGPRAGRLREAQRARRGVHHPERLQQVGGAGGSRGRGARGVGDGRGATAAPLRRERAPVKWSVVIPAFNEAIRLPPYLDQIFEYFEGGAEPYEVLVVNDASTDATGEMLRAVSARQPALRVLSHDVNHGKGGAVRAGMLAAKGD